MNELTWLCDELERTAPTARLDAAELYRRGAHARATSRIQRIIGTTLAVGAIATAIVQMQIAHTPPPAPPAAALPSTDASRCPTSSCDLTGRGVALAEQARALLPKDVKTVVDADNAVHYEFTDTSGTTGTVWAWTRAAGENLRDDVAPRPGGSPKRSLTADR